MSPRGAFRAPARRGKAAAGPTPESHRFARGSPCGSRRDRRRAWSPVRGAVDTMHETVTRDSAQVVRRGGREAARSASTGGLAPAPTGWRSGRSKPCMPSRGRFKAPARRGKAAPGPPPVRWSTGEKQRMEEPRTEGGSASRCEATDPPGPRCGRRMGGAAHDPAAAGSSVIGGPRRSTSILAGVPTCPARSRGAIHSARLGCAGRLNTVPPHID